MSPEPVPAAEKLRRWWRSRKRETQRHLAGVRELRQMTRGDSDGCDCYLLKPQDAARCTHEDGDHER